MNTADIVKYLLDAFPGFLLTGHCHIHHNAASAEGEKIDSEGLAQFIEVRPEGIFTLPFHAVLVIVHPLFKLLVSFLVGAGDVLLVLLQPGRKAPLPDA